LSKKSENLLLNKFTFQTFFLSQRYYHCYVICRSESQYVCECVQAAEAGILLLRPSPEINTNAPSQIHLTPTNIPTNEFCVMKIIVVSESKHLELYIDDIYEMTSKGCTLSLKKGR